MKVGDLVVIKADAPLGTYTLGGFSGEVGMISKINNVKNYKVVTKSGYTTGYWWGKDEIRMATTEECVAELRKQLESCI